MHKTRVYIFFFPPSHFLLFYEDTFFWWRPARVCVCVCVCVYIQGTFFHIHPFSCSSFFTFFFTLLHISLHPSTQYFSPCYNVCVCVYLSLSLSLFQFIHSTKNPLTTSQFSIHFPFTSMCSRRKVWKKSPCPKIAMDFSGLCVRVCVCIFPQEEGTGEPILLQIHTHTHTHQCVRYVPCFEFLCQSVQALFEHVCFCVDVCVYVSR
jgi:hypothetical protein